MIYILLAHEGSGMCTALLICKFIIYAYCSGSISSTCNVDKFQCSALMDHTADMPCPTILQFYY